MYTKQTNQFSPGAIRALIITLLLAALLFVGQARGADVLEERPADLTIAATAVPNPANAGGTLAYTITIKNVGKNDAVNITLTNTLPAQTVYLEHTSGIFTCGEANGSVTCNLGSLQPKDEASVTVTAQVSEEAAGILTNQSEVSTESPESNYNNNTYTLNTQVVAAADLGVTMTASPQVVPPGGQVTYTVVVTNNGPALAQPVTLTDILPQVLAPLSAVPSQGECAAEQTISCTLGSLGSGQSVTVNILAQVASQAPTGLVANEVSITSSTSDPDLSNNQASAEITVAPATVDMSITKSGPTQPVNPGSSFAYSLSVSNAGPATATQVRVEDTLPASLTFQSVTTSQGTCSGTTTLVCSLGEMQPGGSASLSIQVRVNNDAQGEISNTAQVSSQQEEANPANNQAVHSVSVVAQADLRVTVVDDPDPVMANGRLDYSITVANLGPSQSRQVVLALTLPEQVTYVSSMPGTVVCSLVQAILTCPLGNINSGESKQVSVEVKVGSTVEGSITMHANVSAATVDTNLQNNSSSQVTTVIPQPTDDVESPTLTWLDPVTDNNARVDCFGEMVLLSVSAHDNIGIDYVRFYRWDAVDETFVDIGFVYNAPYEIELDTSSLRFTWNDVRVRAYDKAGNSSDFLYIWMFRYYEVFSPVIMN